MANLLVADDDDLLVELVRFKLEARGHTVRIATNGSAALEAVSTERPDIVVLDSMMPVMNGREVLRSLRSNAGTSRLPVIMLTARKGQDDIVAAIEAGATDYVTKPFIPDELLARIDAILRARVGQPS